ncbi:MAG: DUF202 domain-containing protein [Nitrospira sp. LK70]|nr:DUF202 domain-containing protein [Nitrospira sp. LK70]
MNTLAKPLADYGKTLWPNATPGVWKAKGEEIRWKIHRAMQVLTVRLLRGATRVPVGADGSLASIHTELGTPWLKVCYKNTRGKTVDEQLRNQLSRHRTELANERTLLAYIRTALGFVIVGIPAMWILDHPYMQALGGLSLAAGAVCLVLGLRRFLAVNTMIAQAFGSQVDKAA